MSVFNYKGVNARGKEVKGLLDTENASSLKSLLKRNGIYLTEYRESSKRGRKGGAVKSGSGKSTHYGGLMGKEARLTDFFGRVKLRNVQEATQHLCTLYKGGIPIVESLEAVIEQIEHEQMKGVLANVRRSVMEGASLADALAQYPKAFPRLYINMIRAGESSGTLDIVLQRLSALLQSQVQMRSKVTAALTYPFVMAFVGLGVVILLMVAVIPRFEAMFDQMGVPLPWTTRFMIGSSRFFMSYWWLMFGIVILGVLAFRHWKATHEGQRSWDRFRLNLPKIGSLYREIALARFSRTLGTLLSAGVPLLTSLEIVKAIVGNTILEDVLEQAIEEVREGQSLAVPLKRSGEFPAMVCQMIAMGERTGQVEEMLLNAAEAYEVQVNTKLSTLTTLLEPLMILMMGGIVGLLVASVLMPLLDMNKAFSAMN
jgi:general secretion pathway protein F